MLNYFQDLLGWDGVKVNSVASFYCFLLQRVKRCKIVGVHTNRYIYIDSQIRHTETSIIKTVYTN